MLCIVNNILLSTDYVCEFNVKLFLKDIEEPLGRVFG